MNRLGAERRPFLFVIDYKQEQVIVEEPDQIDSEALLYNLDGVTNVVTASRMNDREPNFCDPMGNIPYHTIGLRRLVS